MYGYLKTYLGIGEEVDISEDLARVIIRDVLETVTSGYSSKPDLEAIIRRIRRNRDMIYELIVSKILEHVEKPTPRQLEFIICNGGKAIIPEINRLYKLVLLNNREDLMMVLRYVWEKYGPRGFVQCPRCGFKAISPDNHCIICGHVVTDSYIKSALGFEEKFKTYVKIASVAELRDVLQLGYILVGEKGVYSPRSSRARIENTILYTVYLGKSEVSAIIEEINSRDMEV
ncbi:MAG: hypothetical protein QXS23_05425 [Desulfurococcaceae archaeon]